MSAYYLNRQGQSEGPFTLGQLKSMWASGSITSQTQYAMEGWNYWEPLGETLEHFDQGSVAIPKNRGAYIILGILFGPFGFHNFYAARNGVACLQLILSVLLCWTIIVPMTIWALAIVEVCARKLDGNGVKMT